MTTVASPIKRGLCGYEGCEIKVFMLCEDAPLKQNRPFDGPNQIVDFWREEITKAKWYDPEKEAFVVLCLDRKNKLKAWNLVSLGTATNCLSHPREVFRPLIAAAATAFVVMHSHPSGDPAPSSADIEITGQLKNAAKVVDIQFHDHVIIGDRLSDPRGEGFYSFRKAGFFEREMT